MKEAILEAAEQAGGEDGIVGYLVVQALANPSAFMSLLGKVLPMTIADTVQNEEIKSIKMRVVWPEDRDGNIIKPSWWEDDEFGRRAAHHQDVPVSNNYAPTATKTSDESNLAAEEVANLQSQTAVTTPRQ